LILFLSLTFLLALPSFSQYAAVRIWIQSARRSATVYKGFKIPQSTLTVTQKRLPNLRKRPSSYSDDLSKLRPKRAYRIWSILDEPRNISKLNDEWLKTINTPASSKNYVSSTRDRIIAARKAHQPAYLSYLKYSTERTTAFQKIFTPPPSTPVGQPITSERHVEIARALVKMQDDMTQYHRLTYVLGQRPPTLKNPPPWYLQESNKSIQTFYRFALEKGLKGDDLTNALKTEVADLQKMYAAYKEKIKVLPTTASKGTFSNLKILSFQEQYGLPETWLLDKTTRAFIDHKYLQLQHAAENYLDLAYQLAKSRSLGEAFELGEPQNLQRFFAAYLEDGKSIDQAIQKITTDAHTFQKEVVYWQEQIDLLDYLNIQQLQSQHNLPKSGVYDFDTQSLIESQKAQIGKSLRKVGIRLPDPADQIRFYKQYSQRGDIPLKESILLDQEAGYWFTPQGQKLQQKAFIDLIDETRAPIQTVQVPESKLFVQFSASNPRALETQLETVSQQLSRTYLPEENMILNLVKDRATERMIKSSFARNQIKFSLNPSASVAKLKKQLAKRPRKTVFVVGHVEEGKFVTYHKGQKIFEVSIDELMQVGKDLKLNIFPFGCNSSMQNQAQVGTTALLNSYADTQKLIEGIKSSKDLGTALQKFAGDEFELIVNQETFRNLGYAEYQLVKRAVAEGGADAVIGGLILWSLIDQEDEEKENR
ncbi:MAG: hypothetical protein AAF135_23880, partial [Bacteroidota bacterium]